MGHAYTTSTTLDRFCCSLGKSPKTHREDSQAAEASKICKVCKDEEQVTPKNSVNVKSDLDFGLDLEIAGRSLEHVLLGDGGERFQVAPDEGVHEHHGVLLRISLRNVHHVGLDNHGFTAAIGHALMQRRHRPVILQPVPASQHSEAAHVIGVIKNLQPLYAVGGGQARDQPHLPNAAGRAFAYEQRRALQEMLVGLRLIEPPNNGPHQLHRRVDLLVESGTALMLQDFLIVVTLHEIPLRVRQSISSVSLYFLFRGRCVEIFLFHSSDLRQSLMLPHGYLSCTPSSRSSLPPSPD
ncbi:hypothetical protein Mapa_013049 [Marchantia paleacea]|nr:hypothetical protein Mapa_013049 [Marchantia paleacea]